MERKGYEESSSVLDLALLKPRELFVALKELVRSRTISCFGWTEGSYALLPEETAAENAQPFRADPLSLVQEGSIRIDRYSRLPVDQARREGHVYSDKAPGLSLFGETRRRFPNRSSQGPRHYHRHRRQYPLSTAHCRCENSHYPGQPRREILPVAYRRDPIPALLPPGSQ